MQHGHQETSTRPEEEVTNSSARNTPQSTMLSGMWISRQCSLASPFDTENSQKPPEITLLVTASEMQKFNFNREIFLYQLT